MKEKTPRPIIARFVGSVVAVLAIVSCSVVAGLDGYNVSDNVDGGSDGSVSSSSSGSDANGSSTDANGLVDAASNSDSGGDSGPIDCAATGGIMCGGVCVDPKKDPAHCGGCATTCVPAAACEEKSGGALPMCVTVADELVGLRYEIPCQSDQGQYCTTNTTQSNRAIDLTGSKAVTYELTLRFRGIIEQSTYNGALAGGATGTNASFFVRGGTRVVDDQWFGYAIDVQDPVQKIFLNNGASGHSYVDEIDYVGTIRSKGNSTLHLTATHSDNLMARNMSQAGTVLIVPNIPPAPLSFNGQFIQIDVQSVTIVP